MQQHNFTLVNLDTDSISFCKENGESFTTEEIHSLLTEINNRLPSKIKMSNDGYFPRVVVLRAKNYILYDGKSIKLKGSSLKSSTLEPALKEFMNEIINSLLFDKTNFQEIYYKYVKEINNVTDIKRWASKKTLTEKTYSSERLNETKLLDAVQGSEMQEGDKVYVYYRSDDTLSLVDNFDGDYHKDRFYKKLFNSTERFATILNVKELFPNFALKRNKKLLEEILK